MTEQPKDGGPAFPTQEFVPLSGGGGVWANAGGMSLRDWFAGQALSWAGHDNWTSSTPKHLAERAYQMADAMLAARGAQ